MPDQPNVLFITTDQQRAEAMGCAGNPAVTTPNLDRLAAGGIRFDNAICQAPVCTPNRASWLTGQYIDTHGVWANGVPLRDGPNLLPRLLWQAGYGTAMIGKLHVTPSMSNRQPLDGAYGFDRVRLTEGRQPGGYPRWLHTTAPDQAERFHHGFPPSRRGDVYEPEEGLPEELQPARWVADQALLAWKQRVQHRPLFMHVSFPGPHHAFEAPRRFIDMVSPEALPPCVPPPEDWDRVPSHFRLMWEGRHPLLGPVQKLGDFDEDLWTRIRRYYYAHVNLIDHEIGRVLEAVREADRPTLVVFASDHGELLGDHGLLFKGLFHYDALLKTPLVVAGHGVDAAGHVVEATVQHIDIMPTVLRACGVTVPHVCQGQVLPGVGRDLDDEPCAFALSQQRGPWHTPEMRAATLRSNRWKLSLYAPCGEGELYDLVTDPQEQHNLWDDPAHRDARADLTAQLALRLMQSATPGDRRTFRA